MCRFVRFRFFSLKHTLESAAFPKNYPGLTHLMASIQKTVTGWRAQVAVKGKRDSRTFDTKAQAQEWSARRETELRSIQTGLGSKTHTVGDVLDRYELEVCDSHRGARWEKLRLALIGRQIVDGTQFRHIRLAELRSSHITAWRNVRLRDISGASVSREMTLLSNALRYAREEWHWLVTDPMTGVRRPPDNPPRERLISSAEIDALLIAMGYAEEQPVIRSSQRVAVAFLVAIETAMRSGELLGLTSQTVDFERRVAYLPMTKNGNAREVPLSRRAVELLQKLPAVEPGEPMFALAAASRDALFRKAKEKAGIADLTFHDSRHEAITRLAAKLQPLDLARMTGHTNLNELLTYYNASAADIARRLG